MNATCLLPLGPGDLMTWTVGEDYTTAQVALTSEPMDDDTIRGMADRLLWLASYLEFEGAAS